jgi:hypothetical protein
MQVNTSMDKKREDCYFWTDISVPEKERKINVLCQECHLRFPDLGWFWEGSRLGYGPFDFICKKCGHVVYSESKRNDKEKQDEDC